MLRTLIVLHRYTGVVVGLLMTLWCLSGFVMMYQSFPELTLQERLRGLEPVRLEACCDVSRIALAPEAKVTEARLEMAAGRPYLRLATAGDGPVLYSLDDGRPKTEFSPAERLAVAASYGRGHGIGGAPREIGPVDLDQWSVPSARGNRPMFKFAFDDPSGTEIYLSGRTGEVFQDTNRNERVLSWMGAIPHWLYPTLLRQNGALWTQVVIWSSTVGVFLTVTGLVVGVLRIGKGRPGRISPYKGIWFWHHMIGLAFGLLTLTWVTSGLLTMNPWGLLDSDGGGVRAPLTGSASWSEVQKALHSAPVGAGVQIIAAPFVGETRVIVTDRSGRSQRYDSAGRPAPVTRAELTRGLERAGITAGSLELIAAEDAYYYGHHDEVALPVWRAILTDADGTRVYIDDTTGKIVRTVDAEARGSRWFSAALHSLDLPGLRKRPVWDMVVLPLLAGVTMVCALGAWMGLVRVRRDLHALWPPRRRRARRGQRATPCEARPSVGGG